MSWRDVGGACVVWLMLVGTDLLAGPQLRSTTPLAPEEGAASQTPAMPWPRRFMPYPEATPELEAGLAQALGNASPRGDTRPPCVMPVVEADPAVDPGMVVPVPDTGVRFSMRTIEVSCAPLPRDQQRVP